MTDPFLTFYTPTFRRPDGLAACLASVGAQTVAAEIEQIVIPDHVGIGVAGMYKQVSQYAGAVHGKYAHLLCDDDVLHSPNVVARLKEIAEAANFPPVLIVSVVKGGLVLPLDHEGPPVESRIDLGCLVVRSDVWKQHVGDYGQRYEGDFDFADALWKAGHQFVYAPELLFLRGAVSRGAAEAATE